MTLPGRWIPWFWTTWYGKARALLAAGDLEGARRELSLRNAITSINQVAWWLDDIAFGSWRDVDLVGPIFVLGHQRSATTFIHRVLVEDLLVDGVGLPFAFMALPSVTAHRLVNHARARRIWAPWAARINDRVEQSLGRIHHIALDAIEEDEFALWTIGASGMCVNDSPAALANPDLDYIRAFHTWPRRAQRRAMGWYRAAWMKRIKATGATRGVAVSKNPAFGKCIDLLDEVFPQARYIHIDRDPVAAVASRFSLVRAIWRLRHGPDCDFDDAARSALLADSAAIYQGTRAGLAKIDPARVHRIEFDDVANDPLTVIDELSRWLDLGALDPERVRKVEARLDRRDARRQRLGSHRYSLEELGLDPDEIRAACGG